MPATNFIKFFLRNNYNHNLRSESELQLPNVSTAFKGQNSLNYFQSVIWNSISINLRKASSYQIFRPKTKKIGDRQTAPEDTKTAWEIEDSSKHLLSWSDV